MRRVLGCLLSSAFFLPVVIACPYLWPRFLLPAVWACHLATILLPSFNCASSWREFLHDVPGAEKPSAIMALLGCYFTTTASERESGRHLLYKLSLSPSYIRNGSSLHSSYDEDTCKPIRVDSPVGKAADHFEQQEDVVDADDVISLENDKEEEERQSVRTKSGEGLLPPQPLDVRQDSSAVCSSLSEGKVDENCPVADASSVEEDQDGDVAMTDKKSNDDVSSVLKCGEVVDEAVSDVCAYGTNHTPTAEHHTSTDLDLVQSSDEELVGSVDDTLSIQGYAAASERDGSGIAEIAVISEGSSPDTGSLMLGDDDGEAIFRESRGLRLKSGAAMIPHPSKVKRGGEDAYFISDDGRWLGVADGVGGWAQMGIDAGLYSRELMSNSLQAVRASTAIEPSDVLIYAHRRTHAVGSSTALLASLDVNVLKFANIGDCGFLVISNGRVVKASIHMQHAFNFPYQIGTRGDDPAEAERYEVDVKEGDIVVMGSDGLFDNLFHEEIGQIASESKKAGESPQVAAEHIARLAQQRASRTDGVSPFAVAAMFAGFRFEGGKMDDITVLVSYLEK